MIENTAHPHPYPEAVPHPSTLNDLRVHNTFDDEPAPTSTVALSGMVLVVILAIAAFVWLDPLHLPTGPSLGIDLDLVRGTRAADREARDHRATGACPCDQIHRSTERAGTGDSGTAGSSASGAAAWRWH